MTEKNKHRNHLPETPKLKSSKGSLPHTAARAADRIGAMAWGGRPGGRSGGGGGSDASKRSEASDTSKRSEATSKLDSLDDLNELTDEEIDALLGADDDPVTEAMSERESDDVEQGRTEQHIQHCQQHYASAPSQTRNQGTGHREGADPSGSGRSGASVRDDDDANENHETITRLPTETTPKEHKKVKNSKERQKGKHVRSHLPFLPGLIKPKALLAAAKKVSAKAFTLLAVGVAKVFHQTRDRPKHTAVCLITTGGRSVSGAVGHALLVSFLQCFAPTRVVLSLFRVGATVAGLCFVSKLMNTDEYLAARKVARALPQSLIRKSVLLKATTIRVMDAVSPIPLATVFTSGSGGLLVTACVSVSKTYLRNALRLTLTKRIGQTIAPLKTRQVMYGTRVAPVVGAYVVKKEIITRTTEKGSNNRNIKWEKTHAWGSDQIKKIVLEYGGFFTKIGQIMGTAEQMMPSAYITAFSQTMDANPRVAFSVVKQKVTSALLEARARSGTSDGTSTSETVASNSSSKNSSIFEETFSEFDETPTATASIAQVHFARLRKGGLRVAVKVVVADKKKLLSDLRCASATADFMKLFGLDTGADFPTVFAAYSDVVEEEFDLTLEAEKMDEFRIVFDENGLSDKVVIPEVVGGLSTSNVLVMSRLRGVKMLTLLNKSRDSGRMPKCPLKVAEVHAVKNKNYNTQLNPWDGLFHTMHKAWGVMLCRHGHFHCDPHPGNFLLQKDGKLAILDWGQTQSIVAPFKQHVCRLVVHMVAEHHSEIANEVRNHSEVLLENPSTEALSALCFAYFDTRQTPLADINLMDLTNSPFLKNKITRNTREGFNIIRCVFLFRGMMSVCGVQASMVQVWESDARTALVEMNLPVPSLFVSRSRRLATRVLLGAQKALNVGTGARLNTLEAFAANTGDTYASGNRFGATDDSLGRVGSVREGLISPGTPRRMRSALW
tara:strand:+ start:4589 stop:7447 length:2859 start_codon:yes stop_codon:yes gene_type:complete